MTNLHFFPYSSKIGHFSEDMCREEEKKTMCTGREKYKAIPRKASVSRGVAEWTELQKRDVKKLREPRLPDLHTLSRD